MYFDHIYDLLIVVCTALVIIKIKLELYVCTKKINKIGAI